MAIPKFVTSVPTGAPIVRVILTSTKDSKGTVTLDGTLRFEIIDQKGEDMGARTIDLFPHLTTAQTTQIQQFIAMIRTKVESEVLG